MSRSSKGLSMEWLKGLSEAERESMTEMIRHDRIVLSRLLGIIDDKLDVLERTEISPDTYENPAYPLLQAHINGKRASLTELRRLLEFLES
jgi:hypothetical protein